MDPSTPRVEFSDAEIIYAVWLVSTLEPERFTRPETRALIAKAKACADAGHLPVPARRTVTHTVRRRWFEIGID